MYHNPRQSLIMYHNPRQSLIIYHNPRQTLLDIMNSIQLEFKSPPPPPPPPTNRPLFFFLLGCVYTIGNTGLNIGLKCQLSTVFLSTCASTVGHQWGSLNMQGQIRGCSGVNCVPCTAEINKSLRVGLDIDKLEPMVWQNESHHIMSAPSALMFDDLKVCRSEVNTSACC